jgi:hypothetical protein
MSSATLFASSVLIHRLQLLNSLLAVTETHDHPEDVVTHGSLQVRHDKLRNRMATLRGCVRRVAAHDREGKPGHWQPTMTHDDTLSPQCLMTHLSEMMLPYTLMGLSARSVHTKIVLVRVLSWIPDSGKSGMVCTMGMGVDPRSESPANRGWGWEWTPDPRRAGDRGSIPDPRQIGDRDGDGDRGFRVTA